MAEEAQLTGRAVLYKSFPQLQARVCLRNNHSLYGSCNSFNSRTGFVQVTSGALLQVQQMITTAAAILPQTTGQAQLTEASPQQASSEKVSAAPVKWNAPVLTKKVRFCDLLGVICHPLVCTKPILVVVASADVAVAPAAVVVHNMSILLLAGVS